MKLWSVSVRWTPKGMRKSRGVYGYVFAETKEEAKAKFSAKVTLPDPDNIRDRYIDWWITEESKEVLITKYF